MMAPLDRVSSAEAVTRTSRLRLLVKDYGGRWSPLLL